MRSESCEAMRGSRALVLHLGLLAALAAAAPCADDPTQHCPACEFVDGHLVIHAHSAKDFNFHCAKQPDTELCACKSHTNGVKSLEMHGKVVHLSVGSKNAEPTVSSCTHSNRVPSTKWHRGQWGCQYGRVRGTPSFRSHHVCG